MRGVDGHGVSRLPRISTAIARGEIDPKAQPRFLQERAATFVLDGGRGFGPVAMMQAITYAVEAARNAGVCFGLVRETTHTGAIGRYAQWIAERGCAAIIMVAGPAFVAYHGARVASLGTSPIAIARARAASGPIVLDMATSSDLQRQDHAGPRHRRGIAARHRADREGRADHRSAATRRSCCRSAGPRDRGLP